MPVHLLCGPCAEYVEVRFSVIGPRILERCAETGEFYLHLHDRFLAGVHARHLSGLPILPDQDPSG